MPKKPIKNSINSTLVLVKLIRSNDLRWWFTPKRNEVSLEQCTNQICIHSRSFCQWTMNDEREPVVVLSIKMQIYLVRFNQYLLILTHGTQYTNYGHPSNEVVFLYGELCKAHSISMIANVLSNNTSMWLGERFNMNRHR